MTTQNNQPQRDRPLYRVTLFLSNGGLPVYNCRADSPEAAIRKITEREAPALSSHGLVIEHGIAEILSGT